MQQAKCKLDGENYYVHQFAKLPPDEITEKRQHLTCSECDISAFYRRETRNGRHACFGSHHAEGCQMAAIQTTTDTNRPNQNWDYANNQEQRIVVDFAYGTAQTEEPINHTARPNQFDDSIYSGSGTVRRQNIVSHRRLSSILRDLIASPQFCNSNQILHVAGFGEATVSDFFMRFDNISNAHVGRFMGYWGRLTCAKEGDSHALWLNTGKPGDLSILVPFQLADALRSRFGIEDRGDLTAAGMFVLVFGTLHVSWHGKPYIEIADLCSITMCNPPSY
jgi:hypothetical protein